jgi:hypothetical protein
MWLRDFLHLEFPDIRVLTWGYYSSIRDDRSTTSITAISRNFLLDIKRVRDKEVDLIVLGVLLHSVHHDVYTYFKRF